MNPDLSTATWLNSTDSGAHDGRIEVAFLADGRVALRDSEQPDGPILLFTAFEWECFVDGVEHGEFNRTAIDRRPTLG